MTQIQQPTPDVDYYITELLRKQAELTERWRYYEGDADLRYSAERLATVFPQMTDVNFSLNLCALVVDTYGQRINLTGFNYGGEDDVENVTVCEQLRELFTELELHNESDLVTTGVLVFGEAYYMVWVDPITEEVQGYYHDPRVCHIKYADDNPRRRESAAKWYYDAATKRVHLTIYYPDRLEYYQSRGVFASFEDFKRDTIFEVSQPAEPNTFGEIPFFHFRFSPVSTRSELTSVIPVQDAVSKLLTDMMVASEFGSFRQRWVITNSDIGMLTNAPNEIWDLPAGDEESGKTQVGEFSPTDLQNYLGAVSAYIQSLGAISGIPRYIIEPGSGEPSGESLRAQEGPLVKRAKKYIELFEAPWSRAMSFAYRLAYGVALDESDMKPTFENPNLSMPSLDAMVLETLNRAEIPYEAGLVLLNYDPDVIIRIKAIVEEAKAEADARSARALLKAQAEFDAGAPVENDQPVRPEKNDAAA